MQKHTDNIKIYIIASQINLQIMRKMKNGKVSEKQMKKLLEKCYIADQEILNLAEQERLWKQVIDHKNWQSLRQLILTECNIDDKGLETVTNLQWRQLQNLVLDQNVLTGIRLLTLNNWEKLTSLTLSYNNLESEGIQALLNCKSFPSLTELFLTQVGLSGKDFDLVLDSPIMKNLKMLHLNFNELGPAGVKALTKIEMVSLITLEIWDCMLGDEGVKYLSKSHWPNLEDLNLDYTDALTTGFTYLSTNNWKRLNGLRVSGINSIDQLTFIVAVWKNRCIIVYEIDGQETDYYSREAWKLKYYQD